MGAHDFDRYNVFRTDRSEKTSKCKRGGGVAILVDKRFLIQSLHGYA